MALAIIATAITTSTIVSAQNTAGPNSLVAAIAAKFNLNQADVQEVFDEEYQKHRAEMKAQLEQRLTQAVKNGKITEVQKQAILAKHQEIQYSRPNRQEFENLAPEQRRAKMDEKKAEMDEWLSQNGLTRELFRELTGGFPGKGGRGMMMIKQ